MKKLLLFGIAVLLGLGLFIDNSFFKSFGRGIASVDSNGTTTSEEDNDLSNLSGAEFNKAFKYRLMLPALIIQQNDHVGVQLGNFYIKGSTDQKIFVCSKYSAIELTFEADGLSVAGDVPQMTVRGPCLASVDFNSIEALMIPYKGILQSPLTQNEFHDNITDSQERLAVYFHYIGDEWPRSWNLTSVKLYSDYSGEILSLNGYEVISILGHPLTLDWTR